ncbi:thioredoxin [Acidiluteibacter ferrifornacis]|uniref:Thioredoxin n=1 Tax=Acidiluteibacter ferrifornacis TaxID=2692424 RepID=A0A6N9NI32_9FLAO|nr:thioredoxin [Acidiluteibacter ferrifornacis]NBG65489.1 thioredoxin [Acidiluteibacter ferrifornacis]
MKEINNVKEYNTLLSQDKPILLDFYAEWCGPCQALLPVVAELAAKNEAIFEIHKVNVDQQPELAQQFGVRSIPALFFIKNGKVIDQLQGNQPQSVLQEKINKYSAN